MNSGNISRMKIQLLGTMVLFGSIGLIIRNIHLPSSVIAMTRGLVGALCLAIYLKASGRTPNWGSLRRKAPVLVLSGAAMGFNWILLFEAYRYTTVAAATLAYYLAPIIVIVVSALTGKERLTPFKGFCACLALGGMVLVSGVFSGAGLGSRGFTGILFGTGAAVLYAVVVLSNLEMQDCRAQDTTLVQLAVAGLVLVPYVLLTEDVFSLQTDTLSLVLLPVVALVYTAIGYALYFDTMKVLKPQTIAIYSYLDPLTAVVFSALVLKEDVGAFTLIGGAMILGSTFLTELADRRKTVFPEISTKDKKQKTV